VNHLEPKDDSPQTYIHTKTFNGYVITDITDMLDKRINRSIYIRRGIINKFSEYAKATPEGVAHHHELALLEYMITHPIDSRPLIIQRQILSTLPSKQEEIRMKLIGREIGFILERLDKVEQDIRKDLVVRLGKLLLKGADIKNATEEFVMLLEEGMKHI